MEKLSRQRRWQLVRQAEGKCPRCGQKLRNKEIWHCARCAAVIRVTARNAYRRKHGIPLDKPLGRGGRPRKF